MEVAMRTTNKDVFLSINGERVARRGLRDAWQSGNWISTNNSKSLLGPDYTIETTADQRIVARFGLAHMVLWSRHYDPKLGWIEHH